MPFEVACDRSGCTAAPAGLTLKLRLDRVDRLNDGSLLVIDYKTGNVSPKAWELPRPDDVQLPLYAGFALPAEQELGDWCSPRFVPETCALRERLRMRRRRLTAPQAQFAALVKNPLTRMQLSEWKAAIEQLARDFIAGRADVDPRDYPKTCERCGLYHALPRSRTRRPAGAGGRRDRSGGRR